MKMQGDLCGLLILLNFRKNPYSILVQENNGVDRTNLFKGK